MTLFDDRFDMSSDPAREVFGVTTTSAANFGQRRPAFLLLKDLISSRSDEETMPKNLKESRIR